MKGYVSAARVFDVLTFPTSQPNSWSVAKRVLIADDNAVVRNAVKTFLTLEMDVVCEEAADGCGAVEHANQGKPDLIILDFAMPKMNGAEAAQCSETFHARSSHRVRYGVRGSD
jgi:PleD family two-component response regulator